MKISTRGWVKFGIVLLALVAVFYIGRYSGRGNKASLREDSMIDQSSRSVFTSPLLDCGDYQPSNLMNNDANDIQSTVSDYLNSQKQAGNVTDGSVYFRDLNNGPYVNINGTFTFAPGSMLKVPLAIALYQEQESDPTFFLKKTTFQKNDDQYDTMQYFAPPEKIQVGTEYQMKDLIRYMLVDSDNNAAALALGLVDPKTLQSTYQDLSVAYPSATTSEYTITAKSFSSFFRILYNASYISKDHSEELLATMSQSPFTQGLVAGIPKGVVVSHKFGERTLVDGTKQLNDCGIVYRPGQPYIVCVMVKGTDFDALANAISNISSLIYTTLDKDS